MNCLGLQSIDDEQFDKNNWEEIISDKDYTEKNNNSQEQNFKKDRWEKITQGTDYTEHYKEKKPKENKQRDTKDSIFRDGRTLTGGLLEFAKIFVYVIIIGVLAFLLFFLLKKGFNFFNEKVPEQKLFSIIENLEDNIHNADFDDLLDQAVNRGEYKLAVRIFYLRTIKQLSDKEFIKWKREKTNGHYAREMSNKAGGKDFALLTTIYEQVWFGNYQIKPDKFAIISGRFKNFLDKID